jgi:hypothetical protein
VKINKLGGDWLVAKAWLEEQISKSQRTMEGGLSSEEYNFERGRIALARAMVEFVEPTVPPQTTEDDYGMTPPETGNYT